MLIIPLLALVEKVVIFGIDMFTRDLSLRDERRTTFSKFMKKSGQDSQSSAHRHQEYEKMKKETQWPKDKNSQS